MTCFIDTNVLLYYFATDASDASKRHISDRILERSDCVISVQVLQEFYVQATRPNRADGLSHEDARKFVWSMLRFRVQPQTVELMLLALELRERLRFSYWDSAIIAAATLMGCDTLFTEDLQHGQQIGSLRLVNPYEAGADHPS